MRRNSNKAAALIVALGKKPDSSYKSEETSKDMDTESESDEGKLSAAEDILSALNSNNAEDLMAALDAYMDCCE